MIEELLPDSVVAVEAHGDEVRDAPLYPEEEALMTRAVAKRRREFSAVRACARRAMDKLGVPPQAVVTGASGAPVWPAGLVGSMTHSDDYCAAALARATDLASLGIDAEPHSPLPDDVASFVFLPTEAERLRGLAADHPAVHWDRILFSAKESVYKAWFPLTGKWLDFAEADIEVLPDPEGSPHGRLSAGLLVPGPRVGGHRLQSFEGRWSVRRGVVTTAVVVPHA
ncbi:4'-phosphopantetheinyl transferase family protein [Streptomyces brasiliensis]|uniref:4'-phosphopantetheinyl transferase n=1 Tax=Streptomyces brasiliensis TaxID=1954 RepID=A0A917LAN0_9ACTN|nr:4'-phosphopantetheinyl transferase superfamily protein [Streptomyces brasiliensis]GGJ50842.1 4'-phosphopantetheinyl transferase [Streptomyces brasiliensis]